MPSQGLPRLSNPYFSHNQRTACGFIALLKNCCGQWTPAALNDRPKPSYNIYHHGRGSVHTIIPSRSFAQYCARIKRAMRISQRSSRGPPTRASTRAFYRVRETHACASGVTWQDTKRHGPDGSIHQGGERTHGALMLGPALAAGAAAKKTGDEWIDFSAKILIPAEQISSVCFCVASTSTDITRMQGCY